jgi:hypothetical protein
MKYWLKSKTIWGVIITMLPTLAPLVGIGVDDLNLINQTGDNIIQIVGAIIAAYGRFTAKDQLTM